MTQNEKDLLLKDLCARLLYGVKINYNDKVYNFSGIHSSNMCVLSDNEDNAFTIPGVKYIKPYLFPMSSMTEEQKEEHKDLLDNQYSFDANGSIFTLQDFYCKYHFDYRGLIPMGLAIDATGLNIY